MYIVRLVVPLLAIPILARIIPENEYGVYMYAISFSAWISIFVEYGFNISSTRDIASGNSTHDTVAGTQSAKLILTFLTTPLLLLATFSFPAFSGNIIWAFTGWLFGVMSALSPIYYFQGKERMRLVGVIETLSGFFLLGGIFFFVRNANDAILLPYILLLSKLTSPLLLTFILTKETGLRWRHIAIANGVEFIRKGFDFFIFQAAVSLYTSFNVVFLGFFCTPALVGVYASAERVMRAGLGFIGQASIAIFPRLNALKTSDPRKMSRVRWLALAGMFAFGLAGIIFTWSLSPYIAKYFFGGRVAGVDAVMNIMALLIPAIALSNVLGFQYLVVDRRERAFNKIIITCALLNVPLSFILINSFMEIGMAYSWVIIEWVIALAIAITVFKYKNQATGQI